MKTSLFKDLQRTPLYPLLFAAYPAIALLGFNIDKAGSDMLWRPLGASLALGAACFLVLWLFFRHVHKAMFLTALWPVFNTYFGGKYDMLEDVSYFSSVPYIYDFSKVPSPCGE